MARIRTIKPEFWRHEDLSELPAETHMLAAALLNYADDEGYFNANPKLVKAECCPLREDAVSVHDSLTDLSNLGYIRLGEGSDGKQYGQVVTFADHQRINRPTASKIAAITITWPDAVSAHTQITEPSHPEGKGTGNREGNREQGISSRRSESSVDTDPPEIPEPVPVVPKKIVPDKPPADSAELLVIPDFLKRTDDTEAAFDAWNTMAAVAGLPLVQNRSETRKKHLRARLAECDGLEGWRAALDKVQASSFLTGAGDRGWKADFDFFVTAKQFTKIMEGGHDDGDRPQSETQAALERMRAEV